MQARKKRNIINGRKNEKRKKKSKNQVTQIGADSSSKMNEWTKNERRTKSLERCVRFCACVRASNHLSMKICWFEKKKWNKFRPQPRLKTPGDFDSTIQLVATMPTAAPTQTGSSQTEQVATCFVNSWTWRGSVGANKANCYLHLGPKTNDRQQEKKKAPKRHGFREFGCWKRFFKLEQKLHFGCRI